MALTADHDRKGPTPRSRERFDTADSVDVITRFRSDMELVGDAIAEAPTAQSALERAAELTGRSFALTDDHGTVLASAGDERFDAGCMGEIDRADTAAPAVHGDWWVIRTPARRGASLVWMSRCEDCSDAHALLLMDGLTRAIEHLDHMQWVSKRSRYALEAQLADLVLSDGSRAEIEFLATKLDRDVDRPHCVVLLRNALGIIPGAHHLEFSEPFRACGMTTEIDDDIAIVIHDVDELDRAVERIRQQPHSLPVSIGISSTADDAWTLSLALEEARIAIDSSSWTEPGTVTRYEELDLVDVITARIDARLAQKITDDRLGALIEYDRTHDSEFVRTLGVWLDTNGSLDQVACRLHIHKNTLTYRLRRIKDLLGSDLCQMNERHDLHLAIRLLRRVRPELAPHV